MLEEPVGVPWDSRWKPVVGFPGYYVSQYAQVFSMKRKKLMKPWPGRGGFFVTIQRDQKAFSRGIDQLANAAFPKENN